MLVSLNGQIVEASKATVSIFDRGYLYGDSVFETLRAYRGKLFELERHLRIFAHAATTLGMSPPPSEELRAHLDQCVTKSGLADAYVRLTMSRGEGGPGLGIAECDAPLLSVVVRERHPYRPEAFACGIASSIVTVRKVPAACLDPAIKTGNYLNAILARRELAARNQLEGVQLAVDGQVVSGTISNLFLVKDGVLRTPNAASGCRLGVTRDVMLELARDRKIVTSEERLELLDLHAADEIFFTNTLMECLPVSTMEGRALPSSPGEMTLRLRAAFTAQVAHG